MADYQCNACGGTFTSPQGQFEFYHACPPLSTRELLEHVQAGTLQVDAATQADVALVAAGPGATADSQHAFNVAFNRLAARMFLRPGHVDQNLKPNQRVFPIAGQPPPEVEIISHGKGVTKL